MALASKIRIVLSHKVIGTTIEIDGVPVRDVRAVLVSASVRGRGKPPTPRVVLTLAPGEVEIVGEGEVERR